MTDDNKLLAWVQERINRPLWLPAQVMPDGSIENAVQALVKVKGARKGEGNFKTSQRPARKGTRSEGVELGTFVQNMHPEVSVLETKEIDIDARTLRYGRTVRARNAYRHMRKGTAEAKAAIFDAAAANALRIIAEKNLAADKVIVQGAAGKATIQVAQRGATVNL